MTIKTINALKKYFDIFKVIENCINWEEIEPVGLNMHDVKLLNTYEENEIFSFAKSSITLEQWKWFDNYIKELTVFHISYFPDKSDPHSKGINVYAIDSMSACEQFESETGFLVELFVRKK